MFKRWVYAFGQEMMMLSARQGDSPLHTCLSRNNISFVGCLLSAASTNFLPRVFKFAPRRNILLCPYVLNQDEVRVHTFFVMCRNWVKTLWTSTRMPIPIGKRVSLYFENLLKKYFEHASPISRAVATSVFFRS